MTINTRLVLESTMLSSRLFSGLAPHHVYCDAESLEPVYAYVLDRTIRIKLNTLV
ncbi:hypothetical protein [Thalassolituus sp.]|uniref:hypothetical protein n=1 Tax=Thalassolituus sp. TaxID=2030822 RepID=UPI002A7EA64F|nr:hypothetical protein [Thalassolituus sp.]